MTYQEAIRYLYSFVSYEKKTNWTYSDKTLNLQRFKDFLHLLGNPQDGFRSIHVAGSDGKGSVCAMTASALRAMGYRVGIFSSPHLHDVRERIAIDGEWISKRTFARWTNHLKQQAERHSPLPQGYVTFFELITAMAFLHFQEEKVDFGVIETGMGGRLDTTNVMHPCVTTITHISMEHTEQLGNTLEAIANEKLGITRPDVPIVIGRQDKELLPHFHIQLSNVQAPVTLTDENYRIASNRCGQRYREIEIESLAGEPTARRVRIPLFGRYQMENAVTALATLDALVQNQVIERPSQQVIDKGFRNTTWPGRFEIVRGSNRPTIILDVAHTAKGAASLRLSLDEQFPKKPRVFLVGFLQGKKIEEMLKTLIRPCDALIVTKAPTPRGASLETIKEALSQSSSNESKAIYIANPKRALAKAMELTPHNQLLCVCGSLYLVGAIRDTILTEIV